MKKIIVLLFLTSVSVCAQESGLKKVNFENETADMNKTKSSEGPPPSIPKEVQEQLMKELEIIKQRQEESRKALEELEKNE